MTTQKQNSVLNTEVETAVDNTLVHLDSDNASVSQANDINNKIDFLDGSLGHLNAELESIKNSVEEGLDRLGDNDLDLTAKVSDTYKRLGELDKTYKSLIEISSNINNEIQKLTGNISEVALHSNAELEKLEATTEVHNTNMVQQNESIVGRVNQLVTDSHQTSTKIQLNIRDVRETIIVAEKKLVAEIDMLATSTHKDHALLSSNLDVNKVEIQTSKARIIKLEKVDEALVRRAGLLEISSEELNFKSKEMSVSVEFLDKRTTSLSDTIVKLVERTEVLTQESQKHGQLISDIQGNLFSQANKLKGLAGTVGKHFKINMVALMLVVVAGVVFYNMQMTENNMATIKLAEHSGIVNNTIIDLNSQLQAEVLLNKKLSEEVTVLNTKIFEEVAILNKKVTAVDDNVKQLGDQAQSLDGRLNTVLPYESFGGDNIIHSEQWLAKLPADKFIIQLAVVANKQDLYELAQSYNHYLKQPVSYVSSGAGNYTMFYGVFDSSDAAMSVLHGLPSRFNWQRPSIRSIAEVQQRLAS